MNDTPRLKLSRKLFFANVLGTVMVAVGVASLAGGTAQFLPILGNRLLDGLLLMAGFALMGWFLVDLFKRIRVANEACARQTRDEGSDPNGSI
ncbi:MAG: hypothetical protein JO218_07785 [Burkholderiales bacterium]|nr:hypothetical protein [Burkholderiales bacterium]